MTRIRLLALLAFAAVLLAAPGLPGRGPGPVAPLPAPAALAQAPAGEPRIVGGTPVPVGTYRFTTLLYIQFGADTFMCGGTLIDPNYVLTAAHCVTSGGATASPGNVSAYVGANDRTTLPTTSEVRGVSRVAVHPNWNASTFQDDVAVLRLSAPVTTIAPIGLPAAGASTGLAEGTMLTADGWGRTSTTGPSSAVLLEAQVPVWSSAGCDAMYPWFDTASMMCAGPPAGGTGICFGDSGGPLFQASGSPATYTQIGITSWTESSGCALPGRPAGYAKIADPPIRNWIAAEVSGVPPTPPPPTATPAPTATPTTLPTATPTPSPTPTPDIGTPVVAIVGPADGQRVKRSFTVAVSATDEGSAIARVSVTSCHRGACREIAAATAPPWEFPVTLGTGKRTLEATAVDAAGNVGASEPVTVQVGKKKRHR